MCKCRARCASFSPRCQFCNESQLAAAHCPLPSSRSRSHSFHSNMVFSLPPAEPCPGRTKHPVCMYVPLRSPPVAHGTGHPLRPRTYSHEPAQTGLTTVFSLSGSAYSGHLQERRSGRTDGRPGKYVSRRITKDEIFIQNTLRHKHSLTHTHMLISVSNSPVHTCTCRQRLRVCVYPVDTTRTHCVHWAHDGVVFVCI